MFNTRNGSFQLGRLRGEDMDRLFSDLFQPAPAAEAGSLWDQEEPPLNAWEDEGRFHVEVELPGFKLEDLEIFVVKNELTLRGERKDATENGRTFHRRERGTGPFARVVRLPAEVEAEKVEATLRDGVLTISLPKAAQAKPRKIQVVNR